MSAQSTGNVALQEEMNAVTNNTVDPSDKKKKTGFDPLHFNVNIIKHVTYEYVVMMVLNAVGIKQVSDSMKKTADKQKVEDTIHSIIDHVGKLIQTLSGYAEDPNNKNALPDSFFKDPDVIKLVKEVKTEWKQLYGTDGKGGDMAKWKAMLDKDDKGGAEKNPTFTMVKDLYTGGLDSNWAKSAKTDGHAGGVSFTDWLNKGNSDAPDYDLESVFKQAYETSHQHNDPEIKDRPSADPLGETTTTITNTASTVGGLTNSNSTQLTQDSQELTSYVQIGQKILSTTDQLKSGMVRNSKPS